MRTFAFLMLAFLWLVGCTGSEKVNTVSGPADPSTLGKTLHHEHLLVDFIGADSISESRWNRDSVVDKVLPYLLEIKKMGYQTLVECTPEFLGRDPELLKILSAKSGITLVTNTGLYTAVNSKFLPSYAFSETPEQLAQRWIGEARNGIGTTGVYPGFIKIAVERKALEEIQVKIVTAAALTHLETGLTIMSHTGLAEPAFQQIEILKKTGVDPSAFIWTHAHNEKDSTKAIEAARMGVWIAYDNFNGKNTAKFVRFAEKMKEEGLLNRLMFSHDAGWYKPGEPGGGNFRGFTAIELELIPALRQAGFSQTDLDQLFITNPADAFTVKVRPHQKQVSDVN